MPRKTRRTSANIQRSKAGFNEAAARCRGKPAVYLWGNRLSDGFNEAAARCRGKHRRLGRAADGAGRLQ